MTTMTTRNQNTRLLVATLTAILVCATNTANSTPLATPLSATGWNVDFILGNGETYALHEKPVRSSNALWFAENSTMNVQGLPASGAVTAAGIDFQFQSFTDYTSNALFNNGTLTLVTPRKFSTISLLGSRPGTDTTATLTLNFSDAASSGTIPLTFASWIGTSQVLPNPQLTNNGTDLFQSFSGAMSVFTYDLVANGFSDYTLQSITVESATANAVFALNGIPVPEPGFNWALGAILGGLGLYRVRRKSVIPER